MQKALQCFYLTPFHAACQHLNNTRRKEPCSKKECQVSQWTDFIRSSNYILVLSSIKNGNECWKIHTHEYQLAFNTTDNLETSLKDWNLDTTIDWLFFNTVSTALPPWDLGDIWKTFWGSCWKYTTMQKFTFGTSEKYKSTWTLSGKVLKTN